MLSQSEARGRKPRDNEGAMPLLQLNPRDNVAIAREALTVGTVVDGLTLRNGIPSGHKAALRAIAMGEPIVKYGSTIGHAATNIAAGEHVHTHNVTLTLEDNTARTSAAEDETRASTNESSQRTFLGYKRASGKVGTRNYIGVLTSVNCSATVAKRIAAHFTEDRLADFPNVDGVVALTHSTGCAMSGNDEGSELLRRTIAGYANHPNFAAVLLLGLGCEANQVSRIVPLTHGNITATTIQEEGGTKAAIARGIADVEALLPAASAAERSVQPISELIVGLQCGGSDAWSGITANPALGLAMDKLIAGGATALLSETPEIFGAEHLLTSRASPEVAAALMERIAWWQRYAALHGNTLDNNPSHGNKLGGLTTILEKSLGAVAKAGSSRLKAVIGYAEPVRAHGLVFMDSPGYDPVSATGQIASGANLICFTTGRGSVFGAKPVPSLKVATTTSLFRRMADDMDLNAGTVLDGEETFAEVAERMVEAILSTASGKKTKSEELGFGEEEFQPWILNAVL